MTAYRGKAPFILNFGTKWRWMVPLTLVPIQ